MSLLVAVPLGIAAAIAYGAGTAGEHAAAHTDTGRADPKGLFRLLRDPRWLMSIGGDAVGLVLQILALVAGPVVLIQPLLVLALPVSLPIGWALGGPKPARGDYLGCLSILGGLALFAVLVGDPGAATPAVTGPMILAICVAVAVGSTVCLAARGQSASVRAGVYGGVAGAWFGLVSVLMDAAATSWQHSGVAGLAQPAGLTALIGLVVLGAISMLLTQISFQVGVLEASFPASLATDPVVAVVLGAVLLQENVPVSVLSAFGYVCSFAAVVAGAVLLANPRASRLKDTAPCGMRPCGSCDVNGGRNGDGG